MEIIISSCKRRSEILIDEDVFQWASKFKWHIVQERGSLLGYPVRRFFENGIYKSKRLSREIMNVADNLFVDHINHNTLDNRKSNLRICTTLENNRNTTGRGRSKYLGVSLHTVKRKNGSTYIRWVARIKTEKKRIVAGYFKTEDQAALAYNELAKIHFGEFANLNIISQ